MTITVPLPTKVSLNKIYGGIHWSTRKRHKDEFREAVWAVQPTPYTGDYPVHISYYFQFTGRRFDTSNVGYMVKLLEDALIAEGVIPDDSPQFVGCTSMYSLTGKNEVTITIEPCVS